MCECYFEPSSVTRSRYVRARVPHRCVECRCRVEPGATYQRLAIGAEGTVNSYVICAICEAWGDALGVAQGVACGCSGWEVGRMWQALAELAEEHLP